jgi:hypothetical protein
MTLPARAALCLSFAVGCADDATTEEGTTTISTSDGPTTEGSTGSSDGTSGTTTRSETDDAHSGDTDTASDVTSETTGGVSSALVSIDPQGNRLLRVDVATGTATEVCALPAAASYDSVTFASDGTLFAHNVAQGRIETINPCNCGFQIVGLTGTAGLQITTDGAEGLVGLDLALDALSLVNPSTGLSTVVGPLGLPVTMAGVAWDFDAGVPIMIDVTTNALYTIDQTSGLATHAADLSQNLTAAGMDMLAATGELFVCAGGDLHRVDTATGATMTIGPLRITNACHTLAAPPAAIACLE